MSRLIDADAAQSIADKELSIEESGIVQHILSHTPTEVNLVRCGECKNRIYLDDYRDYWCPIGLWNCTDSKWFCADGERRDG